MMPASKIYGRFIMRKRQILTVCAVLVVILVIAIIGLWGKGEKPVQEKLPPKHKIESEADEETPVEIIEPKKEDGPESSENLESPGSNLNSDSAGENVQQEPDTDRKPIELPFVPAD